MHFGRQLNCWSLRSSWSIACRRCSNYIFILNLTPGFNGLGKDNCKTRLETFVFWDWVRLILETWRYINYWQSLDKPLQITSWDQWKKPTYQNHSQAPDIISMELTIWPRLHDLCKLLTSWSRYHFKNVYLLLKVQSLRIWLLYKIHIF